MKRMLAYIGVVLLACGCGLDEPVLPGAGGSQIEFSASKMRIITKAGDSAETFVEGTDFRLFAVQSGTGWASDGTKFYNIEGTGGASGKVDYSIDGKKASYDVGKNLDFYGVTYGTSSEVPITGDAGSAPSVSLSLADGPFPDLMYSDNLKNKNSSSGLLQMEFRHTLSKLKFEVLKQDETADDDKKLTNVLLQKVVLKGSAASAVFNAESGEWSYETYSVQDRVVYEPATGLKITESAQMLKSGEDEIEMLVVPNTGQLTLEVTLDMDGDTGNQEYKVVEYALMSSQTEKLVLEQNHEYTFSIVVLKNDVRIVTVTPKVYEWIDVELDTGDAYFGQPVYFGGLMWMDRNLGAKSADCENDWYNSIGYYYQFGRNIPYILDVDAFLKTSQSQSLFLFTDGSQDTEQDAVFNMKYLYTYDNNGKKVTTVKHANHSSGSCLYGKVAITPGDEGDYSYVRGYVYKNNEGEIVMDNRSWAKKDIDLNRVDDSKVVDGFDHHIFWETIENQPCPKGWRLPGKADMYSFMPESTSLYWTDKYDVGEDMSKNYDTNSDGKITKDDNNHANYVRGNRNAAGEVYEWKYFAGSFKIDSGADKSASYSYPKIDAYPRVYGIKYEGEDRVYRVMFEQKSSKYNGKNFVRISRFASHVSDRFEISDDGSQWNIHKFDWNTPVEYMDIPLAGFIYEDGMSDFGKGTILRAKEGDGFGTNWTLYLRGDHNGVAVGGNSRRNLGENIRCVRDINANK